MKKETLKTVQQKSKNADIEKPEVIIISDEVLNDELEQYSEQVPADEETEVIIISDDDFKDELEQDSEQVPADEHPEVIESSDSVPETETKAVAENEIAKKQKIKALKRALENKTYSLDREKSKCGDWIRQANSRDQNATVEYENRKNELEELLRKTTERYEKRMAKTKLQWREYTDNYLKTKVKKIQDDIVLLQAELSKLESLETKQESK